MHEKGELEFMNVQNFIEQDEIKRCTYISTSKEQISKSASARIEAPAFPILQFPKLSY